MNTIEMLDNLRNKGAKIKKTEAKEAASLLRNLYDDTQDNAIVATYLMQFKSDICSHFFADIAKSLDTERLKALYDAIRETKEFKENKDDIATTRSFIFTGILVKHKLGLARSVLLKTLSDVEKNGQYPENAIISFKRDVIDFCGGIVVGMERINKLGEKEWEEQESRDRFFRFMDLVNERYLSPATEKKSNNGYDENETSAVLNENKQGDTAKLQSPPVHDGAARGKEKLPEMLLRGLPKTT
jgi:hypothetical protein